MLGNLTYYYQKPFIVFCETYKFSNRTQLDSFSCNELANPNDLLHNKKQINDFISINLRWDLTPIKFINMVNLFF